MTPARAKAIDPSVTTGLALSTTRVFGDCAPRSEPEEAAACQAGQDRCVSERAPLRVFAVPVNRSVVRSDACKSGVAVADLAPLALVEGHASSAGELVRSAAAGRYLVYLSEDGRCAACGVEALGEGCMLDVVFGEITARDLVLDRSSR
jgi:hypothetical protein